MPAWKAASACRDWLATEGPVGMFGDSGCHVGPSLQLLPHPPALIVGQTHLEPRPSHRLPLQRHSTSSRGLAQQLLPVEQTHPASKTPPIWSWTYGWDVRMGKKKQQHKPTDATDVVHCHLYVTDIDNRCYCRHPGKASGEISLLQCAHRASCWARGTSCLCSSCSEGTKTCLRVLMPRG